MATDLALYQHLRCDLYIQKAYDHFKQLNRGSGGKANARHEDDGIHSRLYRGIEWEISVLSWLSAGNLLLRIPPNPIDGATLLEHIFADEREHFFVSGLSFEPSTPRLADRFLAYGVDPIQFGLAKPDLLEITREDGIVSWRVIDIKSSKAVKASHYMQIYFYTECLNHILCDPQCRSINWPGIWLPNHVDGHYSISATPSLRGISYVDMRFLRSTFDRLLFRDIPNILDTPLEYVKWHFNPLCRDCIFEPECRVEMQRTGALGNIPNISIEDAKVVDLLLALYRSLATNHGSEYLMHDIEDLASIASGVQGQLEAVCLSGTSAIRRVLKLLALPVNYNLWSGIELQSSSPVIRATKLKRAEPIQRYNYTCPVGENLAIVMTLIEDHSTQDARNLHICLTVHSENPSVNIPPPFVGRSCDLVHVLGSLLRSIESMRGESGSTYSCHLYVWSVREHELLQEYLETYALYPGAFDNPELRACVVAFCEGTSNLHTPFQPLLYATSLHKLFANSFKLVGKLIQRRMGEAYLGGPYPTTNEIGQLSAVTVLKTEVQRQIAIPCPGYWDLRECAKFLDLNPDLGPFDRSTYTPTQPVEDMDRFREDSLSPV